MFNKFKITLLLISLSTIAIAQDTIRLTDEQISMFILMHRLSTEAPKSSVTRMPLDEIQKKDFTFIKKSAQSALDSLELSYVEYYSEKKLTWDQNQFQNHFKVTSTIEWGHKEEESENTSDQSPYTRNNFIYGEINFQIDTLANQTISQRNNPSMESSLHTSSDYRRKNKLLLSKKINLKKDDQIKKDGELTIQIKYLSGYDTIKLNNDKVDQIFNIGKINCQLDTISNGKIYIQLLDSVQGMDLFQELRHISFKDNMAVLNDSPLIVPQFFLQKQRTVSIFMNDRLSKLSSAEYEKYLRSLTIVKGRPYTDLIILNTGLEMDEIFIFKPEYEYFSKKIRARVKRKNVDDIQIVNSKSIKTSLQINKTTPN